MPARAPKHRPHKADTVAHVPAEAVRLTTAQRGYGGRWQKARETFLKRAPLCAECQRHGRVTLARIVDHVIPHRGDQDLFWDTSNWQPLCKRCHDVKTAGKDGGFGNRPRGHGRPADEPERKSAPTPPGRPGGGGAGRKFRSSALLTVRPAVYLHRQLRKTIFSRSTGRPRNEHGEPPQTDIAESGGRHGSP